ncbi:22050_t:CDS:2 [Gigaspora margarita]|uniref:22050_t:CDS:1 n=1 Tax=Gigaspora margarita TaxID=4874 RepID=A0ABN7UC45_GIGMA|nr:22050_t:CDS:2 [Gigaspora margarita]
MNKSTHLKKESEFTGFLEEYEPNYFSSSSKEEYTSTYATEEENRSLYITGFSNEENISIYVTGFLEECYESTYHAALSASMVEISIYYVINYNN